MIVHPYLGSAAARSELDRPPTEPCGSPAAAKDPFKDLSIRFTYRTARVLATIATDPGASNRSIADTSGIVDEGQMSRLLARLQRCGLVENRGEGQPKGEPNAWALTERGEAVQEALGGRG
jgi:DNA-binding MarR family transcriptional regulator